MKSSIPSSWGSTRELRFAGGGPWCSWAVAVRVWRCWLPPSASLQAAGVAVGVARASTTTCSTGTERRAAHALDQIRAHPAGALAGQRRDDDVVDAEQLERVHRRRVGVGVADHARAEQARRRAAARASAASRARASPAARRCRPCWGTTAMNRCCPSVARPWPCRRSISSSPLEVLLATTSVTVNGRPSCSRSMTMCSTGRPEALSMRSIRSRRSQPECVAGMRGDDDLVGPALGDRVHRRQERVGVADLAGGLDALRVRPSRARGRRAPAPIRAPPRRRSRAPPRGCSAAPPGGSARRRRPRARAPRPAASRRRACGWRRPGSPSRVLLSSFARRSRAAARTRASGRAASARRCRARRRGRRTRRGRRRRSGTRSKLNTGGGEETCHSSVSRAPRVGDARAGRRASW